MAFSRLLFRIAVPILIVAPTILYGVVSAFYFYQAALQSWDAQAPNTFGQKKPPQYHLTL